jgi:hypothetical protein
MRDFPFETCPTTAELMAVMGEYILHRRQAENRTGRVWGHLAKCSDCQVAMTRLQAVDRHEPCSDKPPIDVMDRLNGFSSLLDAQRTHWRHVQSVGRVIPRIGDVWAGVPVPTLGGSTWNPVVAPLVVVLQTYVRAATGATVVDVAPVTDDVRIAADWSLVVPAAASGTFAPLVIHIDAQFTARLDALDRWVGRLHDAAGADLVASLRAYGHRDAPPHDLECGRLGHVALRTRPEWRALDAELERVMEAMAVSSEEADCLPVTVTSAYLERTKDAAPVRSNEPWRGEIGCLGASNMFEPRASDEREGRVLCGAGAGERPTTGYDEPTTGPTAPCKP